MTLPVPGTQISMSQVNVELNVASTTQISLNDTAVRTLGGKTTAGSAIAMSDLSGKTGRATVNYTFAATTTQTSITVTALTGYVAGNTDVVITVNSGVYVYSTSTASPALTITGTLTAGDTVKLVNNGYIIGMGGDGAVGYRLGNDGSAGGPAMSLGCAITIQNNSYIAGGGGGGAAQASNPSPGAGGGGGAGGGAGGGVGSAATGGGAGGAPGSAGANASNAAYYSGGGGGGRVLPGTGGMQTTATGVYVATSGAYIGYAAGLGGGAGGSGGAYVMGGSNYTDYGGAGGGAGNPGSNGTSSASTGGPSGGGGGGWGAKGGNGMWSSLTANWHNGGAGGAAVLRNGYTITWAASGTVYGSY